MVSVVIITYNRAHLIGEAIQSVLDQTYQDFECIVVDESSKDNTQEVVDEFNDPRIKYFEVPNTKGHQSQLRNYGIDKSSGKYIAFLDSDDVMDPSRMELQMNELEQNPRFGFSFSDIETFDEKGIISPSLFGNQPPSSGDVFQDYINNRFIICQTTLLFRKDCLSVSGTQDEAMHSGGHDFLVRLSSLFPAAVFNRSLVRVRKHDQNTTKDMPTDRIEEHHHTLTKLLDQGKLSKEDYRRISSQIFYSRGLHFLRKNDKIRARMDFFLSFKLRPRNLKSLTRFVLTYF